ncbi:MAG: HXXEE domain-containing protein [Anaerolineales bacterium]|nr:HXXEE domain-containing protein [Anaerolineales bacterium]
MHIDTNELIWLFPIAFMLHDFEELILFEPWLKKNASNIMGRFQGKVPPYIEKQLNTLLNKSTTQFALTIFLIFMLTCLSSILAAEFGIFSIFLFASSLFFMHSFMHIGQAVVMRKYIPAMLTSIFIAIPYGWVLFPRLLAAGIIDIPGLLVYFFSATILAIPFILGMYGVSEYLYRYMIHLLVR